MEDPREMPQSPSAKLDLLDKILRQGLDKLLNVSRSKKLLKPPFGRPDPKPTPLISEDEFIHNYSADDGLEDGNDEPIFDYQYGFNPLTFLADYILWAHPTSHGTRAEARSRSHERLKFRANHAKLQIEISQSLSELASRQRSGIQCGPYTSIVTSTTVLCSCSAVRIGIVALEVSTDSEFNSLHSKHECSTVDAAVEGKPVKFLIENLAAGTRYFLRCCLRDIDLPMPKPPPAEDDDLDHLDIEEEILSYEGFLFTGAVDGHYEYSDFWTPPSEQEQVIDAENLAPAVLERRNNSKVFSLVAFGNVSDSQPRYKHSSLVDWEHFRQLGVVDQSDPVLSCLLGDIFSSTTYNRHPEKGGEFPDSISVNSFYDKKAWELQRRSNAFSFPTSIFKHSSYFLGWNDCYQGSDMLLREEEAAHKQFSHELRRYKKKYGDELKKAASGRRSATNTVAIPPAPVLQSPPISPSLGNLLKHLPLRLPEISDEEAGPRQLYRAVMLSPAVEAFVLDTRAGYLGKQQARWLRSKIESSTAKWKLVLSGVPCGAAAEIPSQSNNDIIEGSRPVTTDPKDEFDVSKDTKEGKGTKGRVQMLLPTAADLDQCDEHGRHKAGLPYMIASLQRRLEAAHNDAQKDEAEAEAGESLDETAASGDPNAVRDGRAQAGGRKASPLDEASVQSDIEEDSSVVFDNLTRAAGARGQTGEIIRVDSGVVILSGGVDIPFAAVYDPAGWNRSYFLEVGVGKVGQRGDAHPLGPGGRGVVKTLDNLGARVLYGASSLPNEPQASSPSDIVESCCAITLYGDQSLYIQILETDTVGSSKVAFEISVYNAN